ncbi:MAG TPA: hypothetical protein PKE12_02845 [Kiritimatiellia bacterium]|nr:hypothetical protein [Kiritimatiellia bacterium]
MKDIDQVGAIAVGMHERRLDGVGKIRLPRDWLPLYADPRCRMIVLARCENTHLIILRADARAALERVPGDPSAMARHIIDNTCDAALDARGWFRVPPAFCDVFEGQTNLVFVGCMTHGELWSCAQWRRYQEQHPFPFDKPGL